MRRSTAVRFAFTLLTLCIPATLAHAQAAHVAELRGVVRRYVADSGVAVNGVQVVLHRIVDSLNSGTVDSLKTDKNGAFHFTVRTPANDSSVYLLSSTYAGIAYFSAIWRSWDLDSADADLMVFDTTTASVPVKIAARHLIIFAPIIGGRKVVEVYELQNDSTVTQVARNDSSPVWRVSLPHGARDFGPGPGAFSPESLRLENGEVELFSPLAPGVKKISFAYSLPDGAFPLLVALEGSAEVMEVLLAEPRAEIDTGVLDQQGFFDIQGQSFKRYVAFDVPAGSEIRITVPADSPLLVVLLIVGVGMLIALAATFRRRGPGSATVPALAGHPVSSPTEVLAQRIAELDGIHSALKDPSEDQISAYNAERAKLKNRLAELLARRQ